MTSTWRKDAETQFEIDVAVPGHYFNVGVECLDGFRGDVDFAASTIFFAEEDGTAQVAVFDGVEIGDNDSADSHQCQVFQHFVAERAGADHKRGRIANDILFPPAYVTKRG